MYAYFSLVYLSLECNDKTLKAKMKQPKPTVSITKTESFEKGFLKVF